MSKSIEMTGQEIFIAEIALRIVLCELLDREKDMIDITTAVAHNLSVDSFGQKEWKPKDPNDWIQYLQPMRDLIVKLDPEYARKSGEFDKPWLLPEEQIKGDN